MNNFSSSTQSWLSWFSRGILVLVFFVLATRLVEVSLIKGNYYRLLSEGNRIRRIPIPAARGNIYAANKELLAGNVEIKKAIRHNSDGTYTLSEDLTDVAAENIVSDFKRIYPLKEKFAHASGYLSEAGENEVNKIDPRCPEKGIVLAGALVGRTGLEEEYECRLRGVSGEEIIEVDTKGQKVRSLGKRDPIAGNDLTTTIDYGLQDLVGESLPGEKGAVVVTNPTGGILAFYSSPSFDPNLFVDKKRDEAGMLQELLNSKDMPFFNRVIAGTFHPGSVFKPLVILAALEEGEIQSDFTYDDQGFIKVNDFEYKNWYFTQYGRVEGVVNIARALARSTDTFFYKVGAILGPEKIAKWAEKFGLGDKYGIDLPGEATGLIPTPEWKKKNKNEPWYLGNTYHMSIGQGDIAVTPLAINTYISAIASEGKLCTPNFTGNVKCKSLGPKKSNLGVIIEGMKEACRDGGTGYTFFDFSKIYPGIETACKTGTAQVGTQDETHAWFTFFAPAEKPQIVATVLVERGGEGSKDAGPIARKIADYYFQNHD